MKSNNDEESDEMSLQR